MTVKSEHEKLPFKFTIASRVGLSIVVVHVATAAYLWFSFRHHPSFNPEIHAPEVTLPLTIAYVIATVKWFFDTRGIRNSDERYGYPLVILITFISGCFLLALPLGPYLYMSGTIFDPKSLNDYYLFVESVLGGMFALMFSEMFGVTNKTKVAGKNTTQRPNKKQTTSE